MLRSRRQRRRGRFRRALRSYSSRYRRRCGDDRVHSRDLRAGLAATRLAPLQPTTDGFGHHHAGCGVGAAGGAALPSAPSLRGDGVNGFWLAVIGSPFLTPRGRTAEMSCGRRRARCRADGARRRLASTADCTAPTSPETKTQKSPIHQRGTGRWRFDMASVARQHHLASTIPIASLITWTVHEH